MCESSPTTPGDWISHTSVMATGLPLGGDVEQALESVGVPSYVLDTTGVVRWINPAAERLLGDVRGRHFTSVVAPEDSRRATSSSPGRCLAPPRPRTRPPSWFRPPARGCPWRSARCRSRAVNGWSASSGCSRDSPDDTPTAPPPHLTPRQVEVLRLLEQGRSTKQIAAELHLSIETVEEPHPPPLPGPRGQFPPRSCGRRPGRINLLTTPEAGPTADTAHTSPPQPTCAGAARCDPSPRRPMRAPPSGKRSGRGTSGRSWIRTTDLRLIRAAL